MFRLATPISSARPISDFDDISTILTHSSLTGSKKAVPWQQHIGEDGHVFYVELAHTNNSPATIHRKTDASSICSLCSTRSCHSCASEDTGYSSDADTHSNLSGQKSNKKHEQSSTASHSQKCSSLQTQLADFDEDDDGVSVDGLDCDKCDNEGRQTCAHHRTVLRHHLDSNDGLAFHKKQSGMCKNCSRQSMCSTKSGLCERHQGKLCTCNSRTTSSNQCATCKHGDLSSSMSQSPRKTQELRKEVVINLRPTGHAWDSRSKVSWFESVLGIIPGHVQDAGDGEKVKNGSDGDQVVIRGLMPDGPAIRNKELLIDDHIYSINGRQLTWTNLDSVVSSLNGTRKVRLVVGHSSSHPHQTVVSPDRLLLDTAGVVRVLSDSSPRGRQGVAELDGVCLLYMSMEGVDSESMTQKDDVLYQFPREESILACLRGSFYTLAHLLTDSADSDTRMLSILLDGDMVNVACWKEGKDLLFVAAPAKSLQASQLTTIMNGILQLVHLLFGSVEEAFRTGQHHSALDEFLTFLFTFLQPRFKGGKLGLQHYMMGYTDYLPLPDDALVSVSNTLTEFEAADFADMSESFYGCRRMFTILGSVVYYKGRVVCSHLAPEDMQDVSLYLRHSGLLHLTARHAVQQLLTWQEIFPTRLCHEVAGINSIFGYSEPHARWFLMVVGVKNTLLACVLEAGGCATQFEGVCLPDLFYMDQARATLVQLQTPDILSAFQISLCGEGLPATTTADKLMSQLSEGSNRVSRNLDSFLKSTASLSLNLSSSQMNGHPALINNSPLVREGVGHRREWRKLSIESDGSSGSGSSGEGFFKTSRRRGRLFPTPDASLPPRPGFVVDSDVNTCKLSAGKENALLVFCQVNSQEGVLITSAVSAASDTLHQQVVNNFRRCCASIHVDFSRRDNMPKYREGLLEDIEANRACVSCREEGVMFTCSLSDRADGKKSNQVLHYWVVGRKFRNPHPREVYVCFHESTPQNLIELAFRLSMGSLSSM